MLEGVERLRAEEMPTLAAARERIVAAALQAETAFTNPPGGEIEAEAMAEERAVFKRFLYDLTEDDLRQVEPLYARASFTYAPPVRTSTDGAEEVITGLPTCTLQ